MILKAVERRGLPTSAAGWRAFVGGGGESESGINVSADNALTHSTVWSCVWFLSSQVAQLPLHLYERDDDGRQPATAHALYPILRALFNPRTTRFDGLAFMVTSLALRGNAIAWIERNGRGDVVGIYPLRWDQIQVRTTRDNELAFAWTPTGGAERVFPRSDVWLVGWMSQDGVLGCSPISYARNSIGYGLAMEQYSSKFFANSANPSGILTHDKTLSEDAHERLRDTWALTHQGSGNAHRVAILEEGMRWQSMSLSPDDAQYLESRKFNRQEIAAWFGIPPQAVGDLSSGTFSNVEQQSLDWVKNGLGAWIQNIEQTISRDLLSASERATLYPKFSVEGLLRGDALTRAQANQVGVMTGWITRNEVRELEDLNSIPGLDAPLVPLNMGTSEDGTNAPPDGAGVVVGDGSSVEVVSEAASRGDAGVGESVAPDLVLNGAQVTSLIQIVSSMLGGTLPYGSALEIIQSAFGMSADKGRRILGPESAAGSNKPDESPAERNQTAAEITSRIDAAGVGIRADPDDLERRNVAARDRLAESFEPVFIDAVARVVRAELREVRKLLPILGEGKTAQFIARLDGLYGEGKPIRELTARTMRAPIESIATAAFDAAAAEVDETTDRAGVSAFFGALVSGYSQRYTMYSSARLVKHGSMLKDAVGSVEAMLESWHFDDQRAKIQARRETVRQSRAAAREAYERSGVTRIKWVASSGRCPFCSQFDGRVVGIRNTFAMAGEVIVAKGGADVADPLRIVDSMMHPPLHRGCRCNIVPA